MTVPRYRRPFCYPLQQNLVVNSLTNPPLEFISLTLLNTIIPASQMEANMGRDISGDVFDQVTS